MTTVLERSMFDTDTTLASYDPQLWEAIESEAHRQERHIELIASENYTSPRVMAAVGSVLTNKYAEGYPGKRYYGGCEYVDIAEELAISRLKKLFGADYANVQPHSGSQANYAVFLALMQPGDTFMGMGLPDGGHLTHGSKVNFSGKHFNAITYGVHPETGLLDYDQIERMAHEHQPKMIMTGFSAYSRTVDWQRFREIADSVGAYMVADIAHVAGLIAADLYPSPVQIADVTTSTTHKTLRGPRSGVIMAKSNPDLEKKLNSGIFPGSQGGPLMHVIAAKAVAFKEAMEPGFKEYQQQVIKNAQVMAKLVMDRGYKVVSGGTDNHMFLIDLIKQGLTGKDAEAALSKVHITVNKNQVPQDPNSPFVTSGLRIGTPAITTRGFKEAECKVVATWICDILDNMDDEKAVGRIREEVSEICHQFPVYN